MEIADSGKIGWRYTPVMHTSNLWRFAGVPPRGIQFNFPPLASSGGVGNLLFLLPPPLDVYDCGARNSATQHTRRCTHALPLLLVPLYRALFPTYASCIRAFWCCLPMILLRYLAARGREEERGEREVATATAANWQRLATDGDAGMHRHTRAQRAINDKRGVYTQM